MYFSLQEFEMYCSSYGEIISPDEAVSDDLCVDCSQMISGDFSENSDEEEEESIIL